MQKSRLGLELVEITQNFITITADAWMADDIIKQSHFGVEILVAPEPGSDFADYRLTPSRVGSVATTMRTGTSKMPGAKTASASRPRRTATRPSASGKGC